MARDRKPAKLSVSKYRATLKSSGLDHDTIETLVKTAQANGTVTETSRGKIDLLRDNFPKFKEIETMLNEFVATEKDGINQVFVDNGHDKLNKISFNISK
jgi:ABC-type uncharacterized transport system YnjBCD substrate-binding protein